MNIVGIVGASAMRDRNVVENLILALRLESWTVSTIKRAPDGFDLDQPGKTSYERREAGCREVMLVGDRRLALLSEFREDPTTFALGARDAARTGRRRGGGRFQGRDDPDGGGFRASASRRAALRPG